MCGRYTLGKPEAIPKRYKTSGKMPLFRSSYNIAPGIRAPVITIESPKRVVLMKWGLIPFWAKDPTIGYKMINARAEGIENKPSFKRPIRNSRCLVPSDGFYEWKKLKLEKKEEKFPWYIGLKDQEMFSFAGLFDRWKDAEGKEILSYSIITCEPNKVIEDIHTRMPVILKKEDEDKWLDTKAVLSDLLKMLKTFPEKDMISFPVSRRVNNPKNDDFNLIKPVDKQLGMFK
jgi:putative SOS response-associated peptidase YedK